MVMLACLREIRSHMPEPPEPLPALQKPESWSLPPRPAFQPSPSASLWVSLRALFSLWLLTTPRFLPSLLCMWLCALAISVPCSLAVGLCSFHP